MRLTVSDLTRITRMTIGEQRCARCEAPVDRLDDCYECVLSDHRHGEHAVLRQLDSQFRKKTHCLKGHEFTDANTRIDVNHGSAYQVCRTCHNARNKATRERQKLRAAAQ